MFLYVSFNHENWGSYVLSGIPVCNSVRLRTPLKRLLWLDSQSLAEKKNGVNLSRLKMRNVHTMWCPTVS